MSFLISFIAVIFVFGIVIFIHELGHFVTAKIFGVKVHEFSMGMGPCLFKKTKGETQYSLRLFPMGGYVKMEGEDGDSDDERAFSKKKPWQRMIILVSGAFMNFVLGFIVIMLLYSFTLQSVPTTTISEVLPGYGAHEAGILKNDRIIRINNEKIHNNMDISLAIGNSENALVLLKRNGETIEKNVSLIAEDGIRYLGIKLDVEDKNLFNLSSYSFNYGMTIIKLTYKSFFGIFKGSVSVNDMSGPVGIVTQIGSAAQQGIENILFILILITLNLGVFNLFPIPALDGGRLVFVIVEMVTRKKIKPEHEAIVHFIGFVLLIGFMLYVTKNDIVRMFGK